MITCLGVSPALDITYLVDRVTAGAIHRPRTVIALPGGKALNAARAILTLGGSARAIVPLGGFSGARVRAELDAIGGELVAIETAGETRQCVTVYDDAHSTTEFYEAPVEVDDSAWTALVAAVHSVTTGWLAVSGSIPDSRTESLADALGQASDRGVLVAVDTHGVALREILARSRPALVKVNRSEAAALLDGDALGDAGPNAGRDTQPDADRDAEELARALSARGVDIAIVTDGAAGAVAARGGSVWHCAPPETGRYAVGSGDCFLAGLLVAFDSSSSIDIPEAMTWATAAAAANTRVPGGALFSAEAARELRAAVIVSGGADG